jgi:hypothetical protein
MSETSPERERLLAKWTERSRRVGKLGDEQFAANKNADPSLAGLDEKIRLAKTEEIEACRAYYLHVGQHDCVGIPCAVGAEAEGIDFECGWAYASRQL